MRKANVVSLRRGTCQWANERVWDTYPNRRVNGAGSIVDFWTNVYGEMQGGKVKYVRKVHPKK
jgi:hypothetical protein